MSTVAVVNAACAEYRRRSRRGVWWFFHRFVVCNSNKVCGGTAPFAGLLACRHVPCSVSLEAELPLLSY